MLPLKLTPTGGADGTRTAPRCCARADIKGLLAVTRNRLMRQILTLDGGTFLSSDYARARSDPKTLHMPLMTSCIDTADDSRLPNERATSKHGGGSSHVPNGLLRMATPSPTTIALDFCISLVRNRASEATYTRRLASLIRCSPLGCGNPLPPLPLRTAVYRNVHRGHIRCI
jgi:hypothetical protein